MRASELIGSNVLALSTAEICGTVSNLIFSDKLKRLLFLEIFIDDEDDCEVKYLPVRSVHAYATNILTVKYPKELIAARPCGQACPVNLPAYDEGGKSLGCVSDMIFDGWAVAALCVRGKEYKPSDILSRSDALIVMKKEGSKIKLTSRRASVPKPKTANPTERKVTITALPPLPRHLNYSFLYGRTAARNISALDGRLIIPAGLLITPEIVGIAKKNGVIAQLAMSSG